ncbi:hypothetical protein [Humisphaera borealis]|uniref:Uncharacterized protein n=1 Tax=Humisphaera borealis TaxID=2807512 RepID=A0A7M2X365_9BACT|nr:hypothetical protein [Humisphaera borealis]QOV92206.1 hypothetical protein IPV69_12960 [Humisphaera borealis]
MKTAKSEGTFLRLQIAEDAKTSLERQASRHGMSQTELASRLVGWLVGQPQLVQAAVLNNINSTVDADLSASLRARIGATGSAATPKASRASRGGKSP